MRFSVSTIIYTHGNVYIVLNIHAVVENIISHLETKIKLFFSNFNMLIASIPFKVQYPFHALP